MYTSMRLHLLLFCYLKELAVEARPLTRIQGRVYGSEEVGHAHVSTFCIIFSLLSPVSKVHDFQLCIIAKWITYCC